jgi:hypothetical protein
MKLRAGGAGRKTIGSRPTERGATLGSALKSNEAPECRVRKAFLSTVEGNPQVAT